MWLITAKLEHVCTFEERVRMAGQRCRIVFGWSLLPCRAMDSEESVNGVIYKLICDFMTSFSDKPGPNPIALLHSNPHLTMPFSSSSSVDDSFAEPYTRLGDDVSLDRVRAQVRALEDEHKANGIPVSGRVLHVCHYLPVISTLQSRAGVISPPATPPPGAPASIDGEGAQNGTATGQSSAWTLGPRYGHAAMISGIRSLAATHEQLIIGWTGDIQSPTPGEKVLASSVNEEDRIALEDALNTYEPKESDPDDDKKTKYVPVWLDDKVAHGHYEGYCKQSTSILGVLHILVIDIVILSPLAAIPLSALARCCHGIFFF